MAANISARRLRSEVLAAPAADFRGHRLSLNCASAECGGERIFPIEGMLQQHGLQQTLSELVGCLRCRVCGKAPTAIVLESGPEIATRGRMFRLSLRGPEFMRPDRNW